ncbi:MAG: PAS-domain containing protein [Alphaproteobacteria bacterium]|nr:PAS-domain containing protein [Alphaproteobacteria bacterium]
MLERVRRFLGDRHTWPLIGLLPMTVFAVGLMVVFARQQGRETESEMRRHLEVLTRGVERRLGGQIALLNAMASLPWIQADDFAPLKSYLESLRPTYPAWRNVVVTDLERQIFNLNLYPEVSHVRERATIDKVVRTRAPVVGSVTDGIVSIRAPVALSGEIRRTIVVALHVSAIGQIFEAPDLPPGWSAIVVDARHDLIARTGAPRPYVAGHIRASTADDSVPKGGVRRLAIEGEDLLIASTEIVPSGWTVALLAPNRIVYSGGIRIDHLLYGAAALAALASLTLLWLLSRSAHRRTEELQVALQRLAESEQRFRDGIDSMGEGFLMFDAEDRLVVWNRRYVEMMPRIEQVIRTGMTASELVDAAIRLTRPDLSAEEHRRFLDTRLAARARLEGSAYTTADGRRIELVDRRASAGGIVSILHDATTAHQWAARLAQSEIRFRDFAETASDWFWETGPDHRYTFIASRRSPATSDPGFAIGKTRIEIARAIIGSVPEALIELERRMDRHEVFHDFEYARPHVDSGEMTIFEASGKPVFGDDGAFLGYRGTGRDVTDRKRQERELARALAAEQEVNAEQRRFIAIVSHEFRTPLTIIDGASQRILARLGQVEPDILKRFDRIRGSVARMTELIDRTLSSARLDTGGIELNVATFDVVALVRDVSERQRQATPDFTIAIDCRGPSEMIEADPRLIDQILTNLLSNAVKYSGTSRRIDLGVGGDDETVEISVGDHGLGIPADEIPKLFTRFFRARTATGLPGTGIGLNLCRELVQLHGGSISAESVVGSGSIFRTRIPRRRPQTEPRAA